MNPLPLAPADPDDVRQTLAFALTFDGRKRFRQADELAMRITADHLARHLERCGFVVMKKPPGPGHSTSAGKPLEDWAVVTLAPMQAQV